MAGSPRSCSRRGRSPASHGSMRTAFGSDTCVNVRSTRDIVVDDGRAMTTTKPMLAKSEEDLPLGDGWRYEPKWDGFRAIVTRDADGVRIDSRGDRPLGRYFPELVELLA